jgi:hypothetical protein
MSVCCLALPLSAGISKDFISSTYTDNRLNCSNPSARAWPGYQPQKCMVYNSGPGSGCPTDQEPCYCYSTQVCYHNACIQLALVVLSACPARVTGCLVCLMTWTHAPPPGHPLSCPGPDHAIAAPCFLCIQPSWGAYREPSFGHGRLYLLNSTRAVWQWMRTVNDSMAVADEVEITRVPSCTQ